MVERERERDDENDVAQIIIDNFNNCEKKIVPNITKQIISP